MRNMTKIVLAAAVFAFAGQTAGAETFVRMVSGPSGGSWYPLGAKIMVVLGKEVKGIYTSNAPGGGVGNVKDVSKGVAEMGWTYAHTAYNGFNGLGKFKKKNTNIRHFATLYPAALQTAVPAKSKIRTYADLKDKNISPGPKHFSGNVATELLLKLYGLTYEKIKSNGGTIPRVGYKDSVALMKDRHIDAFMGLTSVPQASFIDLNFNPGIRFLPVEPDILKTFLAANRGYITAVIPKTAYKGMQADVPTIGVVTELVVNKNVPDEVVYKMVKALWENHAALVKVKKIWNKVSLKQGLFGSSIPVHPGAKRYYDEKGVKMM